MGRTDEVKDSREVIMEGILYFTVGATGTPEGDQHIAVMFEGLDWTLQTRISAIAAFRLGQELIRAAHRIGLPAGTVDQEIPT